MTEMGESFYLCVDFLDKCTLQVEYRLKLVGWR